MTLVGRGRRRPAIESSSLRCRLARLTGHIPTGLEGPVAVGLIKRPLRAKEGTMMSIPMSWVFADMSGGRTVTAGAVEGWSCLPPTPQRNPRRT